MTFSLITDKQWYPIVIIITFEFHLNHLLQMNLQYLTENNNLLPVCRSMIVFNGGGYCNPVNCCLSLLKHCISGTGKYLQFPGYLKRFPP
jgi:hypothetical protein